MKIIAFFNIKGGVGKTTSAINVAYNMAVLHNKKILLIDVDPQGNASFFFKSNENKFIIEDALRQYYIDENENKIPITIKDTISHTEYKNLDIIPTRTSLWGYEKELTISSGTQQFKLRDALLPIESDYDYVIVDCVNVIGSLVNLNVFTVADYIFVPMRDEAWATKGLLQTLDVIEEMKAFNKKLEFGGCFYTSWEKRKVTLNSFDYLKTFIKDKLLDVKIRKHKSVAETSYAHVPLTLYDKSGNATLDYMELTKEILRIVE